MDDLAAADASALAGRRVAIDPGHGGFFRGALGVHGLTEAEVNLGVALHLRGLLEARGATVLMTRTDDRDFLSPADSSLRHDLEERARLANTWGPDLFVSIHHNADARGAHDINETQTYYKLGDDGPSLEAAEDVHRFLVRNLGIAKHRIVPGNYFVLRGSTAPALLTEPSYITNPDVEQRLALAAKQRLEAEALLLGIARYFARQVPVIEEFAIQSDIVGRAGSAADTVFEIVNEPRLRAIIRGAFDRAELTVDGRPVPLRRIGDTLLGDPEPPEPGDHRATLSVGLAGAGSGRAQKLRFRMKRPPQSVIATARPAAASERVGLIGVRVRITAPPDFAFPESITVRLSVRSRALAPAETTVVTHEGTAWAYFHPVRGRPWVGDATGLIEITPRIRDPRFDFELVRATVQVDPKERWMRQRGVMLRRMPGDSALRNAPGTEEREGDGISSDARMRWLNRDGFAVFNLDSSGRAIVPAAPGYRAWALEADAPPPAIPVRWTALCGGALHGRRITVDPAGGGDDDAGTGASGTRGANLNLEVARALAAMLQAAGAEVRLTRTGDMALSEVERVQISEAFRSDRLLRIGHAPEPPSLGYYFSSAAGRSWAERAAAAFASIGLPAPHPTEDAQYSLQQTSCPALYVSSARLEDSSSEERLLAPGRLRAEAYALYLALAREWAEPAPWEIDSLEVRGADGRPLAGAAVVLGDALVLESDASGRVRFARTESGPMEVRVEDPRVRARVVLLDSARGFVLTGPPGR